MLSFLSIRLIEQALMIEVALLFPVLEILGQPTAR